MLRPFCMTVIYGCGIVTRDGVRETAQGTQAGQQEMKPRTMPIF